MPDDDGAGFKYAALMFSPPRGPTARVGMFGGKETFNGKILTLVPETEHARWREWVGSVAWDQIIRAERIVIARAVSSAPDVLDFDDKRLRDQVRTAWAAFLLTGASHSDESAWVFSGHAEGAKHGSPLRTLRSAEAQDRVIQPFYLQSPRYVEVAYRQQWQATRGNPDESWFRLWVEVDELLSQRTPRPPILGYALQSYWSARTRSLLEFSIPEFVRATEGVAALPIRTGRIQFRDRALRLVPRLRVNEYVGGDIERLLVKLYDLRSDCVHGKLPFHDMEARGEEGREEAAQLAYVAEVLGREAMLLALRHPDWSVFESRERLQIAWASGSFPPIA